MEHRYQLPSTPATPDQTLVIKIKLEVKDTDTKNKAEGKVKDTKDKVANKASELKQEAASKTQDYKAKAKEVSEDLKAHSRVSHPKVISRTEPPRIPAKPARTAKASTIPDRVLIDLYREHWKDTQKAFAVLYNVNQGNLSWYLLGKKSSPASAQAISSFLQQHNLLPQESKQV